jgi:hypothetical protein
MTITGKVRKVVRREQSIVLLGLEDEGAGPAAQEGCNYDG